MQPPPRHDNTHLGDSPIFPVGPAIWQDVLAYYRFAPQQRRIVELLLCGETYEGIAHAMELHQSTVRTYLSRVCQKIGVANRNELILVIAAKAVELAGTNQPQH